MKPVMVVGGGIAGIQAALDLAEQGIRVYLVERDPSIGGRMAQLDETFPTLDCASCILTPKMAEVERNENIEMLTYSEVQKVEGSAGSFLIHILRKPSYVDWERCVGCGICVEKCPSRDVPDGFNLGMSSRTAIYIQFPQAVPRKAVIDPEYCLYFTKGICRTCEKVCPAKAIDFEQKPKIIELEVAAIILATGFSLRDPTQISSYGYGYDNVLTSLEFERLISSTGPTNGRIVRRSDGRYPRSIAFIQCVCSRDERFNPSCSAFCCMASVKHAVITKERLRDAECTVFYMDLRAYGKGHQEFYEKAKQLGIKFIRSRPAKVEENPQNKNLVITYEDTFSGRLRRKEVEMVILSVGAKANYVEAISVPIDEEGFIKLLKPYLDPVRTPVEGIFAVGMAAGAKDIVDSVIQASAAAMRASILALGD